MTPLRSKWAAREARGGSISALIRGRRATKQPAHFQRNPSGRGQLAVFSPPRRIGPYEFRYGRFARVRQPPDRYRSADPPSYVDAQGQPSDQLTDDGVTTIWEAAP
jgi:hypothetical protein